MNGDEQSAPVFDFSDILKQEAEKTPARAEAYYNNMNEVVAPVLKTVAVIIGGMVTLLGIAVMIGGGNDKRND